MAFAANHVLFNIRCTLSPFSDISHTTRATRLDNGPIHTGQWTLAEINIVALSFGLAEDGPHQYHMGWPKGAPYDHFPCQIGQPEMIPTIPHKLAQF